MEIKKKKKIANALSSDKNSQDPKQTNNVVLNPNEEGLMNEMIYLLGQVSGLRSCGVPCWRAGQSKHLQAAVTLDVLTRMGADDPVTFTGLLLLHCLSEREGWTSDAVFVHLR